MTVKLTRRGKFVVRTLIIIGFLLVWALLNDLTTPEQCKVPFEEMSQFCVDLLYP